MLCDFYELTMSGGYFEKGYADRICYFDVFYRRCPDNGGFAIAGVAPASLIAGFVTAFVVGCLACKYMINIVKKGKLIWFAVYCAVVGVVAIMSYF